jgi:hypothetical protein
VGSSEAATSIAGLSFGSTMAKAGVIGALVASLGAGAFVAAGGLGSLSGWFSPPPAVEVGHQLDGPLPVNELNEVDPRTVEPPAVVSEPHAESSPADEKKLDQRLYRKAPREKATEGTPLEENTLAEEVALLRQIKSLIDSDAAKAEELLAIYASRYPAGVLRAEYDALVARAAPRQVAPE